MERNYLQTNIFRTNISKILLSYLLFQHFCSAKYSQTRSIESLARKKITLTSRPLLELNNERRLFFGYIQLSRRVSKSENCGNSSIDAYIIAKWSYIYLGYSVQRIISYVFPDIRQYKLGVF